MTLFSHLTFALDLFKFDPDFLKHEEQYEKFKKKTFGSDDEGESVTISDDEEDSDEEGTYQYHLRYFDAPDVPFPAVSDKEGIEDQTGTNLVNLRRVIYLTIMNSLNYEEAVHKLMKVDLKEGQEVCIGFRSLSANLTHRSRLSCVT